MKMEDINIMIFTYDYEVMFLPLSQKAKDILSEYDISNVKMFMDNITDILTKVQSTDLDVFDEYINLFNKLENGIHYKKCYIVNILMDNKYKKYWKDDYLKDLSLDERYTKILNANGIELLSELLPLRTCDLQQFKSIGKISALRIIEFRQEHWQKMKPVNKSSVVHDKLFATDPYDEVMYALSPFHEFKKNKLIFDTDHRFMVELPKPVVVGADNDLFNAPNFAFMIVNGARLYRKNLKKIIKKVQSTEGGMTREMINDFIPAFFRYERFLDGYLHSIERSYFDLSEDGYYTVKPQWQI